MSDRLKYSLLSSLASCVGVFLVCVLMRAFQKWTELLLCVVIVFIITFAFNFLVIQKGKSKGQ